MNVREILDAKGAKLVTVRPEDTAEAAAMLIASNNIGALPVRDAEGDLVGVLSERDIVRGFAERGGKVLEMRVSDLMTADVATCTPDDTVKSALETMKRRHIRHLPVLDDGLVAMLSARDLMDNRLAQKEMEVDILRERAMVTPPS